MTVLHLAASHNRFDLIRTFVQPLGANVNERDDSGQTALHIAARMGAMESLQVLLISGADVAIEDNFGLTASQRALNQWISLIISPDTQRIFKQCFPASGQSD